MSRAALWLTASTRSARRTVGTTTRFIVRTAASVPQSSGARSQVVS